MKTIRLLFPLLLAVRLFGQYQYFFTDIFGQTGIGANWVLTPFYTTTAYGLQWNPATSRGQEGPLIYTGQIPANGRYEIKTVLPNASTGGKTYNHYAAISTIQGLLSYYEVTFTSFGGSPCSANLYVYRVDVVSDGAGGWQQHQTEMGSTQAACADNTVIRTLFSGWPNAQISLTTFVNNVQAIRVFG